MLLMFALAARRVRKATSIYTVNIENLLRLSDQIELYTDRKVKSYLKFTFVSIAAYVL